jgi:hypothetical protein
MAEKIKENQFDKVGVNPFNAPVPGEGLTTSPDTPHAWERPPQYTDVDEALEAVYFELTEFDTLKKLINIINEGVALDEIAQVALYKGYAEGKYNPDMMLLLIEPTIYLLIAIADYADIRDYTLYEGEEDDEDAQIPEDNIKPIVIGDDDNEVAAEEEKVAIDEEKVADSLLAKIKTDLPSKVEEATESIEEKE